MRRSFTRNRLKAAGSLIMCDDTPQKKRRLREKSEASPSTSPAQAELHGAEEGGWRKFASQVEAAGENAYLKAWWRCMTELDSFGWLTNGGVHMNVPPGCAHSENLLQILGSYIDNCIMPLRRMYAWVR